MGQSGKWEHTDTHREGRLPRTSTGLGRTAHPPERSDSPRAAHQCHQCQRPRRQMGFLEEFSTKPWLGGGSLDGHQGTLPRASSSHL